MQLAKLLDIFNQIAPLHLAEDWDKVGLHVGDESQAIRKALLCIDLTEPVVAEAARKKADLIVAYHPPIFQPLERLTTGDWKQRTILECVRRNMAVYSPHTALDAAEGGVNDWLAAGLGKGSISVIEAVESIDGSFEIVTFVPQSHVDRIRKAIAEAGGGQIGEYSECSFNAPGFGTFRGSEKSNPTLGKPGRFETADEIRIEMICPDYRLREVTAALRRAHPYEEPAFYIFPLQSPPPTEPPSTGQGRRVDLDKAVTLDTLVRRVKNHLGLRHLKVAAPPMNGQIRSIALCAGAGISVIQQQGDVDCYLTGEMRHHDVLDAVQRGITVILAGHTNTERPYLPTYRDRLVEAAGKAVKWEISTADVAPTEIR